MYRQLQVFVSSRMNELREERQVVKDALAHLKVIAWVYEDDAGAQSQSPEETYLEAIRDADLFIGLFWKTYGQHTIEEFQYAGQLGKDRLIFVKETGADRQPELKNFLEKIGGSVGSPVTYMRIASANELQEAVKINVDRWRVKRIRQSHGSEAGLVKDPSKTVQYVDRPAILEANNRAYKKIEEAGNLAEAEKYSAACQAYLEAVLIAIDGLESEYDGILIEAKHCWVSSPEEVRNLTSRIDQYLDISVLKKRLDDAEKGLASCQTELGKRGERFFPWVKPDPEQLATVSDGLAATQNFVSELTMKMKHRKARTGVGIRALFKILDYLAGESPSSNGLRELVQECEADETKDRLAQHVEQIRKTISDIATAF